MEKVQTPAVNRARAALINFKKHSDSLDAYFDSSEPSNRVSADTENPNKADKDFKKLIEGDVWPSKSPGLRKNTNRRNK
jgi:hypothetical protein